MILFNYENTCYFEFLFSKCFLLIFYGSGEKGGKRYVQMMPRLGHVDLKGYMKFGFNNLVLKYIWNINVPVTSIFFLIGRQNSGCITELQSYWWTTMRDNFHPNFDQSCCLPEEEVNLSENYYFLFSVTCGQQSILHFLTFLTILTFVLKKECHIYMLWCYCTLDRSSCFFLGWKLMTAKVRS